MEDKVVVIAGGTRGIGASLVERYLRAGYQVITFSRKEAHVLALRQKFLNASNLYVEKVDATNSKASHLFIKEVLLPFKKIDCFYYNVGICRDRTMLKMTNEEWEEVLQTNLLASFNWIQQVFRQMVQQEGKKSIYVMTSLAGIEGTFGQVNYSASKAGLIGLAKSLALEGEKYGVQVNAISPAAITAMTAPMIEKAKQHAELTGTPFPEYWNIETSGLLADTLYQLDQKIKETGKIFSINGKRVMMYEEPVRRAYRW